MFMPQHSSDCCVHLHFLVFIFYLTKINPSAEPLVIFFFLTVSLVPYRPVHTGVFQLFISFLMKLF